MISRKTLQGPQRPFKSTEGYHYSQWWQMPDFRRVWQLQVEPADGADICRVYTLFSFPSA